MVHIMSEHRLEGIERSIVTLSGKVDDMAKVVTALARIEEKHVAVAARLDNADSRLNKHSVSIDNIKVDVASNTSKTATSQWFIRLLVATAVGIVAYMIRS
jgi:hypothetical protein